MKDLWFLSVAFPFLCGGMLAGTVGGPISDVRALSVILPEKHDEFVVRRPLDVKSIERGWQYVLRYVQHDPDRRLSFGLLLVRGSGETDYKLALYEGSERKFTMREFDEMKEEEKLAAASELVSLDVEFAQLLYGAWIRVLLRARYGDGGLLATGGGYFYLSTYALETGHMSAASSIYEDGATTGRLVEVALLLRDLAKASEPSEREKIRRKIRGLATDI